MNSKSYFYKFLRDFLLVLVIPIVTMVLLYMQAEQVVEEQILLSSQNTLNQFFKRMDVTAEEMRQTGFSIWNSTECEEYSKSMQCSTGNVNYQTVEVKNLLESMLDEKYEDIFVYYPHIDRIVSGKNSSLLASEYYDVYYAGGDYDYQAEFFELLDCKYKRPTFCTMNTKGSEPYLCVVMKKIDGSDSKRDFTIVLVVNSDYLFEELVEEEIGQRGELLIFGEDKSFLLGSGQSREDYHLEGYKGLKTPYETQFGENDYMMQVQEIQSIHSYYAFLTPVEYFWEKLSWMQLICGLGGGVSVLIGIYMAYRGSKRSYKPLEGMVQRLQNYTDELYDAHTDTEYEFIESILEKESKENDELIKKIKKGAGIRVERFWMKLLENGVSGSDLGEDDFGKNGITLCSDRFIVSVLSVAQKSIMAADMEIFVLKNVFEELCNRENKGYFVQMPGNKHVIVINLRKAADLELLKENLKEGQEFLKNYYQLVVSIGLGEVHEGMAEIHKSYNEAVTALEYKFLVGEDELIDYAQVKEREFSYLISAESKLSRMVIGYMREPAPSKSPNQFVAEILDSYGIDENASMETVECFRYEIVSAMNKAIRSCSVVIENKKELVMKVIQQPTLAKFQESFAQFVYMIHQKEQENSQQEDIYQRAKMYISENYMNQDLSVVFLAETLDISSCYLSKMYKEKYGVSIPDFISQIRVLNAKKALQDSSKSVKEIAEETGFLSSNVFIRTFKKIEGITPGVYRELLMGEEAVTKEKQD